MLSFQVRFSVDRRTDRRTPVKQYAPDLSMQGHKKLDWSRLKAFAYNKINVT